MIELIISVASRLLVEAWARPCVKPYDSNLSQPVNECPRCAHDFYNGNMREHAQLKDMHV